MLPKQGLRPPWVLRQNYLRDALTMRWSRVTGSMRFAHAGRPVGPVAPSAPVRTRGLSKIVGERAND